MLPRRRTDDVDSNFNFLSKSQARVSPFGEKYSRVESAGNEFLDLVKKSQETVDGDGFESWDDFDVETVEQPESKEVGVDVENQTDVDIANLVEDEDGFLVDEDSLKADGGDSNESGDWVSEDSEDDFEDWGSGDSEEDEDEFESWDDSDDFDEVDSDEDEFESWGTDTSEEEDGDDFDDWGSSDDNEEDFDDWESPSEEDEDDFDDWGSSDETNDADFNEWGSSYDSEDLDTEFEDDADFDDWGSDEEDEQDEELDDDADFDDWGDSNEGSEEETPKEIKGTPPKQVKRSPASELKAETEMMDFFERGVNSLFRSTVSNGKKFGRRFASLPENEEK